MQKHLDFTLVIYDQDANRIMEVYDHATFPNLLVQFLVNSDYFAVNRIEIGTTLYVKVFLEGIEAEHSYMPICITDTNLCSQCFNGEKKEVTKYN